MPICKNCNKRIDRFNKDRCPICGIEKPFEGMSSDTIEITTNIDVDSLEMNYHPRTKKKLLTLFLSLGFTGLPFFYLYKKALGFASLLFNLALLASIIIILTLVVHLFIAYSILIAVAVTYLLNSVLGLYYYNYPNLKDGHGEFVQ